MNKRVFFFGVVMLVIITLVILNVTLFVIKKVEVKYADDISSTVTEADLIASSNIVFGSNIFSLSESAAATNIEKSNPFVNVTSIVRRFPNKVIINVKSRVPLLAMPIADSVNYAILDSELFVLCVVDSSSDFMSQATLVDGSSIAASEAEIVGSSLDVSATKASQLQLIVSTFLSLLRNSESAFTTFIKSISFVDANHITALTNKGLQFVFATNLNVGISEQVKLAYSCYNDILLTETVDITKGYLYLSSRGWDYSESFPE